MSSTTYLSDYVYEVVVKSAQKTAGHKDQGITPALTIDWHYIHQCFGEIADDFDIMSQSADWYKTKVQLMWGVLHSAESAVQKANSGDRVALYQLCQWVSCQHDIADYISWAESDRETGGLQAVLHLTDAFERALGNLYLTKNQPVPFLLRDLLKSPEIGSMFGRVPVLFTQLILGCPKGLNLRNVVWHGFVSPGELLPAVVTGLVVLFASLGQLLPSSQVIPKRPQFTSFEEFSELGKVFPDISSECEDVFTLIQSSPYISSQTQVYWRRAYQLLQNNKFGDCVVLLLPQLEHCLRVIYCRTNKCPARLLTAESTSLYTTLNDILATPTEQQRLVVGPGLLMALLDLLSSMSGPRLRDRLSHGEVELRDVPRWLANYTFCISLATSHHPGAGECHCGCVVPLCRTLQALSSTYRSHFHVLATLYQHLGALLDQWPSWHDCPRPPDLSTTSVSCPHISRLDGLLFPQAEQLTQKLLVVRACLSDRRLPTLYRPRSELELGGSLLSVVEGVQVTCDKVLAACQSRCRQWSDRQLRSRARLTCQRMWATQPALVSALLSVLMVTSLCYRALPTLAQPPYLQPTLRLVRSLTKAVENAKVLCDVDKNRWTEALALFSQLAATLYDNTTLSSLLIGK